MTTINNTRRNSSNTTNNHEITLKILRGDFSKIKNLSIPKRKLEIFVSSTFTDTHFERNILHEIILPKLQEKYRKNNITILFSDLRFGIKDENSNDHSLWELCSQEIQRCYQSSNGFFFLSLQGDKYGYRPLPKILPGETFAIIQEKLIKEGRQSYLDVLLRWYLPNENTIPTRYELIPLIHEKERALFYSSDLEILRQHILKDLCINNSSNIITINRSITEWETSLALRLNPQSCYWIHKTLTGKDSLSKTDGLLYHDCISVEDQQKLTALKREMKNKISTENVFSFNVSIAEYRSLLHESEHDLPDASSPPSQTTATANNYYEKWKKVVTEVLEKELNRIVLEREQWEMKGFECLLPGKFIEEIFHHAKMVEDKSTVFIGRNHLLQECEKIIDNGVPLYDRLQFKAISLALIGKSGSGKTALMAMLAKHYYHRYTSNIPIIIRFCGTSQYSVHAMDLIQSISMQILQIYEENDRLSHYLLKINTFTYNEAVLEFHSIVKAFPAFIFIDSLDQLSNRNEARSRLSFLRDLKIHNRSKLIVSCLPDEFDQTSQTWIYCYYCETRLIEGNVPAVQVPTFAADISSSSTQIEAIHRLLEQLLSLQHRRLTTNQMNIATQSILQEPTILYFNLALKVLKEWKSTETNCLLAPNVKDLVHQIFRSIEINYGEKLVRTAFSLITYTRAGINDLEMQDLLSLDDNVLEEVFQYSAPSRIKRLPIHVWYRLRNVLKDLTVEKTFHCIAWYHRQLWEAAEQRYASEKIRIHRLLASYFSNKVDSFLMRTRLITNHPLTLNDVSIWSFQAKLNERKIIESSYHFIQGGMISQAIDHFCDIEMIYASTLQQDGFYFLTLFTELKQLLLHGDSNGLNPLLQITAEQQRRVNDYYVWLSKEMRNIQRDPKQFLLATARSEPRVSSVWKDLSALLHRLRDEVEQRSQQDPLLNLKKEMNYFIDVITLNGKSEFESVLLDGTEHTDFIKSVRWNADSSLIATGSSDKTVKVWNSLTGEVLHTLSGHRSFVSVVRWHPQLLILATGSWDHSIKIWDATTGRLLHDIEGSDTMVEKYNQIPKGDNLLATMDDGLLGEISKKTRYWHGGLTFHGHSEAVVCIEWHHQGKFLLSLSKDRHIKCWNPLTWTPFFTLYKKEAVECLSLNHTSSHFVTRTDSSIQIWKLSDFEKGEIPSLFQELANVNCIDDGKRNSIAWSADDQMIASGCNDGCVKIWEFNPLSAKFIQRTLFRGHQSHVYSVVWASDNLRLASGGEDKRVLVWNHQTLEILQIFTNHFDFISDLSLNHSDRILASVSYDKTLKLWDIETISSSSRPTLIRASSSERNCICGHQDEVLSIGFCPLSESLYSVSLDGLMIEWEPSSDVIKNQFILKKSGFRHFIRFNAPMIWSFVPPQSPLFAYVENELIVVWDLSRGVGGKLFQLRLPDEFKYTRGEIKSIAWNTQRTVVSAVVDGSFTTSIHIWDISALLLTPTPTTLYDFHYPTHRLIGNFMQWHPLQLNCSVVIARNAIQIMDTQHEKVSRSNASVYSFMFVIWNKSGDAFAAISTTGEIFIISSSTLQIITRFQDQLPIQQTSLETSHPAAAHHYQLGEMYVDWNMKGDRLVSTANHSHNHYLCVWDVNEGKLLVRLFGHKSFITSVLWISDHRIASSSKDHTIKVWEVIENT